MHELKRAEQVGVDDLPPVVEIDRLDGTEDVGPCGVLDQHIHLAESIDRGLNDPRAIAGLGDVGPVAYTAPAGRFDLRRRHLEVRPGTSADRQIRAFASEGECDLPAEPRADPRDDA